MNRTPIRLEPHSPTEMLLSWNTGEIFIVPYFEIRFHCPCASCVDEHTGQRILKRESISQDIRVTGANVVGRYAVNITFSDQHDTGIYHYDRLYEICAKSGKKLAPEELQR